MEGRIQDPSEPLTPSASAGSQEPLQSWSAGAYIDLAADGLMPKDELREKLRGLDAQISASRGRWESSEEMPARARRADTCNLNPSKVARDWPRDAGPSRRISEEAILRRS